MSLITRNWFYWSNRIYRRRWIIWLIRNHKDGVKAFWITINVFTNWSKSLDINSKLIFLVECFQVWNWYWRVVFRIRIFEFRLNFHVSIVIWEFNICNFEYWDLWINLFVWPVNIKCVTISGISCSSNKYI